MHTIGNLTLLTGRLNSRVSNGPWASEIGKRRALQGHDVLMLNRDLLKQAGDRWGDDQIRKRGRRLAEAVLEIWPVPDGHRSGFATQRERPKRKVELADLINAGILDSGATLYARGAGPPSPVQPRSPTPATVVMFPAGSTRRTWCVPASATYREPSGATVSPRGRVSRAAVAGPPSPLSRGCRCRRWW